MTTLKSRLPESGGSDGDEEKVATVLPPKCGNSNASSLEEIVWNNAATFGGEDGRRDKEDIHKSGNTWDVCLTPTCRNTYANRRLGGRRSSFCTAAPAAFHSADVSYCVF